MDEPAAQVEPQEGVDTDTVGSEAGADGSSSVVEPVGESAASAAEAPSDALSDAADALDDAAAALREATPIDTPPPGAPAEPVWMPEFPEDEESAAPAAAEGAEAPATPEAAEAAEAPPVAESAGSVAETSLDGMVEALSGEEAVQEALADGVAPEEPGEPAGDQEPQTAEEPAGDAGTIAETSAVLEIRLARGLLSARLPFYVYTLAWLLFVGVMTYLMWPASSAPFVNSPDYAIFVFGGLGILALGPVLAAIVLFSIRGGFDDQERIGLTRALLLRMSVSMLAGAVIWWAGLIVLDLHRSGIIGG